MDRARVGVASVVDRPAVVRPTAVFVAPTDRRARRLLMAGRMAGGALVAYLALATASLVGAPWVPHLALPRPGPAVRAAAGPPPATLPQTALRQAPPDLKRPVAVTTTTAAPKPAGTGTQSAPSTAPRTINPSTATTARAGSGATPNGGAPTTTAPGASSGHPGTTAPGHTRHG